MSYPFSADAVRNENGYFLFELSLDDLADDYFCSVLTEMLNNLYCSWPLTYGTITLELYSEKGDLLETFTRNYYVSEISKSSGNC